jgi:hypothetical protein
MIHNFRLIAAIESFETKEAEPFLALPFHNLLSKTITPDFSFLSHLLLQLELVVRPVFFIEVIVILLKSS